MLIRIGFNAFKEVERRMKYRFWDKERERSNHATLLRGAGPVARRCLRRHQTMAWSGPPHDEIRAYICLDCHAAACEPEIKDRGFDFNTCPDWIIYEILDLDLKRQAEGNPTTFGMFNGHK